MSIFTQWVVNMSCFRADRHSSLWDNVYFQWLKVKLLFSLEIRPWNSVVSLCCGFEMYFIYLVSPRHSAFIQSLTNTKHRQAESDCRNRDGCTTVEAWRDPHSVHSRIHYSSLNHTNSMLLVCWFWRRLAHAAMWHFLKDVKLCTYICASMLMEKY